MRKFYLEYDQDDGSIGRWDISDQQFFFNNPSGLGLSYDDQYYDIENGFYTSSSNARKQNVISGTLVINGGPSAITTYVLYNRFMGIFANKDSFYFVYNPFYIGPDSESEEYKIKARLGKIEKNEVNKFGVLECQCEFIATGLWFNENHVFHGYYNGVDLADNLTLTCEGDIPSAIYIELSGKTASPFEIVLIGKETGTIYGKCSVKDALLQGQKIKFSTRYDDSYIRIFYPSVGKDADFISRINIDTNPFFKVPLSEPCKISIYMSPYEITMDVTVYNYVKSV